MDSAIDIIFVCPDFRVEKEDTMGTAFLPNYLHVLGDSSYPLLMSLMVPFNTSNVNLNPKELLFNKQWELSWSVVGKAFGKVINRFERLRYGLYQDE